MVTLLLTLDDSQKLQLASAQGNIQFVLRSGADQKKIPQPPPTRLDELISGGKPVPAAPRVNHSPRKSEPAPAIYLMHEIEVFKGTERSVQKVQK